MELAAPNYESSRMYGLFYLCNYLVRYLLDKFDLELTNFKGALNGY